MYSLVRKILFNFDPEYAHNLSMTLLRYVPRVCFQKVEAKPQTVMGITFPNSVGLAAGFDKNADYIDELSRLGFGFIEVGTVTPRPQIGNPQPRLFRLPEHHALINRMGFNNKGVDHLVTQLKNRKFHSVVGVNIGKNADTPIEKAVDDYLHCLEKVYDVADYIVINVSSPNTQGLRELQFGEYLNDLLSRVINRRNEINKLKNHFCPIAVKVSPDLTNEEIAQMAQAFLTNKIDAVIATNTTVSRDRIAMHARSQEAGGLSGEPLRDQATEVIKKFVEQLRREIPVIAVGGILSAHDAEEKIHAGAELVQIYTGFIYRGPRLIRDIIQKLHR